MEDEAHVGRGAKKGGFAVYKVLLAEDELLVRIGLKNSINWEKYGMEIAAEAENGLHAFEEYKRLGCELVITDIRMPGMDGLELIRKIRETDQRCEFIVISCMNDFKLLQDIIGFDVLGYVLKASMTIEEVEELLKKAGQRLEKRGGEECLHLPKNRSREELLKAYAVDAAVTEEEFLVGFKDCGYPVPSYGSVTVFRILPLNKEPMNEMGIAFVRTVIHDNLPDSELVWHDGGMIAFHPDVILCTDSRFGRIAQMLQPFLEGTFSQVTQRLHKGVSSMPAEVKGLLELCCGIRMDYDGTINRAVDYILNHYREDLNLSVMADYVRLSPNYFSTLFKKETGVAFINYLNDIRIEKAKLLLCNTDNYLYHIAEETGFHTVEHFSQTFKQKEGLNPGDWRRKKMEKAGTR